MVHILEDLIAGTVGYHLGKCAQQKETAAQAAGQDEDDFWTGRFAALEQVIKDYAVSHGIYGRNNQFYRELMRIARKYR